MGGVLVLDSKSDRGSFSGMSDGGADIGGFSGEVLGTSVGFIISLYSRRHMDVLVANLGTCKG